MLKRVSIQNFKSLKDVTLDFQKVNLLIGPNNSGKTNFLKALEYMLKDNTNQQETDFKRLVFNQNIENQILIQFEYEHDIEYKVKTVFETKVNKKTEIIKSNWIYQDNQQSRHQRSDRGPYDPNELKSKVGRITIYKPDPNKLDKAGPVGLGEDRVNDDASNLVGFLDLMLSKYRRTTFNQIEVDLRMCVSEFTEINLDDVKLTDQLKKFYGEEKSGYSFKRLGLTDGRSNITYWADEISEGTLYFLALLCIVNQPNPPKVLLLEEPEKGIHPRRIEEIINFIFRLVDDKDIQVIMTTHSPLILDMFSDMPECVHIFDRNSDDGATEVKNLYTDVILPSTAKSKELGLEPPRYTDALSDFWTVGFLGGVPK